MTIDAKLFDSDLEVLRKKWGHGVLQRGDEQAPVKHLPFDSPALNRITGNGTPYGRITRLWGQPSSGKALALDTPLPTPSGWTTMGDVQVGDQLFDENGSPCNVTFVTQVMYNHDVYAVEFADGSEIIADAEHRWLTSTHASRRSAKAATGGAWGGTKHAGWQPSQRSVFDSVVTTEEIRASLITKDGKRNHAIDVPGSLELPDADLPVDPYLLGVWLGDGTQGQANVTTADPEMMDHFRSAGFEVTLHNQSSSGRARRYGILKFAVKLKEAGCFDHKHIPDAYLRASTSQRWDLLCGLMDTDGTITRSSQCEFTQERPWMVDQFRELLASLGIKSTIGKVKRVENGDKTYYSRTVRFYTKDAAPVRLARKIDRWRPPTKGSDRIAICGVYPVRSVPVKCVTVDSESHLYRAGPTMIPTHNTHVAWEVVRAAQHAGLSVVYWNIEKQYDEVHCRENLGIDTKTLLIGNECETIEDFSEQMEMAMRSVQVHIVDSCSEAASREELAADHGQWFRALDARVWKKTIKRIHANMDKEEHIIVLISHAGEDMTTKAEYAKDGREIEFASSMSLHFKKGSWLFHHPDGYLEKADKIKGDIGVSPSGLKEADGFEVSVRCAKSRVCRPLRVAKLRLDLETFHFDTAFELLEAATFYDEDGTPAHRSGNRAIVQKTGAKSSWYELPDGSKVQGDPGIRKRLMEDAELAAKVTWAMQQGW